MNVEEYLKQKSKHKSSIEKSDYPKSLIKRTLISSICVLAILIICNFSSSAEKYISKYLFETNFNFSKLNATYQKYLGLIDEKIEPVNGNNDDTLNNIEDYKDGCKVKVSEQTSIKLLESGIVVFIGKKEGYGNTIIVQQSNGIDAWYANISDVEVTLYSYIEKGTNLGQATNEYYMVFQKNGEFLDYKNYIS